jgi:hypothetical protein
MSDRDAVVTSYIEMWNETDPQRRRELVTGPDTHHDRVRFSWSIAPEGESRSPSASTSPPSPTMGA